MSIDMTVAFETLSTPEKEVLSIAAAGDIVGVNYALYEYIGGDETNIDLKPENFADTERWQKVEVNYSTGSDPSASVSVDITKGQTVLVQLNEDVYGLHRYLGDSPTVDLVQQDYSKEAVWDRLTTDRGQQADHATDNAGTVDLTSGDLVLDKFVVESITIQLWDDINVEAQGTFAAEAGAGMALQTTGDFNVDQIRAGGNLRLQAGGSITDIDNTDEAAAIGVFGDLILLSGAGHMSGPEVSGERSALEIQLLTTSRLRAEAAGDIIIDQIAGELTIKGDTQTTSDLWIAQIDAGGIVKVKVLDGDMYVGKISSDGHIDLQAPNGSLLDIFDDDADLPSDNIVAPITGDVYLHAGTDGNIGTSSNFLEILIVGGELTSLSGEDTFIHSRVSLNIGDVISTAGDVILDVAGDANVDQIAATAGTAVIDADLAIVNRNNNSATNIYAKTVGEQKKARHKRPRFI